MSKHRLYFSDQNNESLNASVEVKNNRKHCRESNEMDTDCLTILSDSDSMDKDDFFQFKATYNTKLPYSLEEDEEILKFLLKGRNIFKASSISLWKYLESKKENPKRTYQSLKNRFLRNIKPCIFSTYRYLIKDEDVVKNILAKYPELKKSIGKKETLPSITYKKRNKGPQIGEDERVSSTSPQGNSAAITTQTHIKSETINELPQSNYQTKALYKDNVCKKFELKGNNVIVSVNFKENVPQSCPPPKMVGIYQKYLLHKKKNPSIPCSYCGRGDPAFDKFKENKQQNESDSYIPCSVEAANKVASTSSSSISCVGNSAPEHRSSEKRKKRKKSATESPSLLDNAYSVEEAATVSSVVKIEKDKADKQTGPLAMTVEKCLPDSATKEGEFVQNSTSQDSSSDNDLVSLFQETVENCRKFIDSDEEERLVNEYFKKNFKKLGFEPKSKASDINIKEVEDFFIGVDSSSLVSLPSTSEALQSKDPLEKNNVIKIADNAAKTPLAKNMVKMLSESSQERTTKHSNSN